MAISVMYGIPQIISFNWYMYTTCGPCVYSYRFTKYVVFPTGVKGLTGFIEETLFCLKQKHYKL